LLPQHPILLAATYSDDIEVDTLATAGIVEVLRSPLVSAELASALARCLNPARTVRSHAQPNET
jgi:hypothetical protein